MIINNTDINKFIYSKITRRQKSLFFDDINDNYNELSSKLLKKKILVIGGAGTIGSNYIKSLLKFDISELTIVDINENALVELIRSIRSSSNIKLPKVIKAYAMDFGDDIFYKYLRNNSPFDIVANFAANKHVRGEKDIYSIEAMVKNNIFKNKKLLNFFSDSVPESFFCVSTDKAANPVNIMGATKKIMEDLLMSYSKKIPVTTARFANVAFSNGSLLDGCIYRIINNQPISSPNDIKRFFVSPEESGQICLLASILGKSGEIYFPKLSKNDLNSFDMIIEEFIKYLGMKVLKCNSENEAINQSLILKKVSKTIPVYFYKTDTTGEKKIEEFYTKDENVNLKKFKSLGFIKRKGNLNIYDIEKLFKKLNNKFEQPKLTKNNIVNIFSDFLPNFKHKEYNKNLDDRM